MRRLAPRPISLRLAAVLALAALLTPHTAPAQTPPEEEVLAVADAFHEALASGDSTRALQLLHPEVRVFEGGHAETLEEYRSGHLPVDMEFSAGTEREVIEHQVFGDAEQAVFLARYRSTGSFRGEAVEARGTETLVLVRTDDGWRIRHIHWSSR